MILAFDTSNYTTSACLFDPEQGIIWQNRMILHPPEQQKGLRQSDVVFLHIKNMETLLNSFPSEMITGVSASAFPRPVEGSYMPCFLVGKHFAKMLSDIHHCPLRYYSHQENHIMAGLYSSGNMKLLKSDFIVFHMSGGTSDILRVSSEDNGLKIKQIGGSNDLHAGQLIDRVGVMLGLQFPCGKELEQIAIGAEISAPNKVSVNGYKFHLSGFENQAKDMLFRGASSAETAKFALNCILKTMDKVIQNIRKDLTDIPILFVGGVMSNKYIADRLKEKYESLYFSDPVYSSDHALGNAVLYSYFYKKDEINT